MRLISKFKDYYDHGIAYGVDPNIIFDRKRCQVFSSTYDQLKIPNNMWRYGLLKSGHYIGYLGFCGYIYPYIYHQTNLSYNKDTVIVWWDNSNLDWLDSRYVKYTKNYIEILKEFFKPIKIEDDIFIEIKSPIFTTQLKYAEYVPGEKKFGEMNITVNPSLKDIGFQKVKNTVDCFNEISMYIGNVLNKGKEIIEVSNKEKIVKAGFDNKSFRGKM